MSRLLKSQLCRALSATGLDAWMGSLSGTLHRPWVTGYHAVVEDPASMTELMPGLAITAATFEQHVDWMARHFDLVSLDRLPADAHSHLGQKKQRRGSSGKELAAITFDDGYRGVFEHAFPILKRKGIPAALFVVSERIGIAHPLAHDQLFHLLRQRHSAAEAQQLTRNLLHTLAPAEVEKLAQQLGASPRSDAPDLPVTWPMLLELHAAGWTIGSHTRSHARLVGCSQEELADETAGSRKTLEQRLGAPVLHFAYPDGAFNPAAIRALVEAGYQHAYTTCAHRDPLHPELTVPRTMLWEHSSMDASGAFAPSILACQSSGVLELVAGCRTKHLVPVHT